MKQQRQLEAGQVVDGTVKRLQSYGAFVTLSSGQTGMLHISKVSCGYVRDIASCLQVGQAVQVKILSVEPSGRIALALHPLLPAPEGKERERAQKEADPFEAMLHRFKAQSEERICCLKDRIEQKRKGRQRP